MALELAQMEAIAADLTATVADLGARVAALEDSAGVADSIAVPNTFFITTFGTAKSPEMFWSGGWDGESGYVPGAVVTFKGRTYVNLVEVLAKPAKLATPPQSVATDTAGLAASEYLNETVDRILFASDPADKLRFTGLNIARVYQFRTPSGSKITLPENKPAGVAGLLVRYSVTNDEAVLLGNFAALAANEITGGKDKTLFFLVVFAVIEHEGIHKPTADVPIHIALTSSGGLTEEPHNTPPPEDQEHWAQLPASRFGEPVTTTPALAAEVEPSPTADAICVASILVPITAGAEAAEYRAKEIGGAGATFGTTRIITSTTITQEPVITFGVPAGRKYAIEKVAGPAPTTITVTTTLLS